jgi:hypothetical protein
MGRRIISGSELDKGFSIGRSNISTTDWKRITARSSG